MMCSKLLQSFSEFRSQCMESNVYFVELEAKELMREFVENQVEDVTEDIQIKEEERVEQLEELEEDIKEEVYVEAEEETVIETPRRSVRKSKKESVEKETNINKSPAKKRRKRESHNNIPKFVSNENTRPDFFICENCPDKVFTNKQYYREHRKIHKEGKFECHFCGLKYRSKYFLLGHVDRNHLEKDYGKRGDFACTLCPRRYLTEVRLKKHLGIHKLPKKPCPHCGELVKNLCSHMVVHNTTERYQCDKCEKSYKSQQHLQIHAVVHQNKLFVSIFIVFCKISNLKIFPSSHVTFVEGPSIVPIKCSLIRRFMIQTGQFLNVLNAIRILIIKLPLRGICELIPVSVHSSATFVAWRSPFRETFQNICTLIRAQSRTIVRFVIMERRRKRSWNFICG